MTQTNVALTLKEMQMSLKIQNHVQIFEMSQDYTFVSVLGANRSSMCHFGMVCVNLYPHLHLCNLQKVSQGCFFGVSMLGRTGGEHGGAKPCSGLFTTRTFGQRQSLSDQQSVQFAKACELLL